MIVASGSFGDSESIKLTVTTIYIKMDPTVDDDDAIGPTSLTKINMGMWSVDHGKKGV